MSPASHTGLDLLRRLGSGVRPDGGAAPGPAAPIEGQPFAALLDKARAGQVDTGLGLRLGDGVRAEFTPEQMSRLSRAADQAEARGATRLVAFVDGSAVTIDVVTRTIESVRPADASGAVFTGVDAAAVLPASTDPAAAAPAGPASVVHHPSLLRALTGGAPARGA